jgi:hypothetical protein
MHEIKKNGPVVAQFMLYSDFLNYSGGIYQHKGGKLLGYYYAKILGWNKDNSGLLYWKAAASFGSNWGENGTFRIQAGECDFESSVIGGFINY